MSQRNQNSWGAWSLVAIACLWILIGVSCTSRPPVVEIETGSTVRVPPEPDITLKPQHRSMREEMGKAFDRADEIIIGYSTGIPADQPGDPAYYFERFRTFDKNMWTWGPETDALFPVVFKDVRPEIITGREFKNLTALDRIWICWDDYEGPRIVYLVEGVPTLLFLRQVLDDVNNTSERILIDTYPVTADCRAKDVFDLMIRDRAKSLGIIRDP